MRSKYNSLPRGITLSPNIKLFKKWLQKYHTMNEYDRFPHRIDNNDYFIPNISFLNLTSC